LTLPLQLQLLLLLDQACLLYLPSHFLPCRPS
jgi:hypothetical protein